MTIALVILAAGKGTRMNSDLPKVLHPIAHAPMLAHALRAGAALEPARTVVVAGHGADQLQAALAEIDEMAEVALHTARGGSAATYTAAGFVRRGLADAGFTVERTPGYGRKRHMTKATLS